MPKKNLHRARDFQFKRFQLQDLAVAALVDRAIISWEPGLGKMLGSIALGLIKRPARVLLVAPGQLHVRFLREAREKFRVHLTPLQNRRQLTAFGLNRPPSGPLRFFLTTFHELGYNNTAGGRPSLSDAIAELIAAGLGFDAVIVDEGTRLQGDDTHLALGVRKLKAPIRYLLTATPIKNRLESFFWLAAWICGDAWPYPQTTIGKAQFMREHLMTVRVGGRTERTARLTNQHHLWRILAPFMIRRRKSDCGEAIVKKVTHNIVLQPSAIQAEVYRTHLYHPPVVCNTGRPVTGFGQVAMQLNYLRQAALCPHSASLHRIINLAPPDAIRKSVSDFNPKLLACLTLIIRLLRKAEQVLIGSPFHAFSHSLHTRLRLAGVSAVLLDGDTDPLERGRLAERFKDREFSVAVAGLAAVCEGLDFDNCAHVILPSRSWAYDENEQFINRVWRITSRKTVHAYIMSLAGTIDERLGELFDEKSATAQLALDCRLFDDDAIEVDLADLLRHSLKSFGKDAAVLHELVMEKQWARSLRKQLGQAEWRFRSKYPLPISIKQNTMPPHTTPTQHNPKTTKTTAVDWKAVRAIVRKSLAA